MTVTSISEQLSKLLCPTAGATQPLSKDDQNFAAQYNIELAKLAPENQLLAFRNVIRNVGSCGFASGGTYQTLLNTNSSARYRVTVRTTWSQGVSSGQFDTVYISEAGGSQSLGCTDSGSIPVAYYSRQIVGEIQV